MTKERLSKNGAVNSQMDFSARPKNDYGDNGSKLAMTAICHYRLEQPKDVVVFMKRYQSFYDGLSVESKSIFLVESVENFYINNRFELGDKLMDITGVEADGRKNLSKIVALYSMGEHTDPDGSATFTFPDSVARVVSNYPELTEDEEMRKAARDAFVTDFKNASWTGGLEMPDKYIQMGLVSINDVFKDPVIKKTVEEKYIETIKSGQTDMYLTIRERYISPESQFPHSDKVVESAKEGFVNNLIYSADDSKEIVEHFLGDEFLEREETENIVKQTFVESLTQKNQCYTALGISKYFNSCLPEEFQGERIWKSELAEIWKDILMKTIKNGDGQLLNEIDEAYGIPQELLSNPDIKNAVMEGIKNDIVGYSRAESCQKLMDRFGLDGSTITEIFTGEFLKELFDDKDRKNQIVRVISFFEEMTKYGLEQKLSSAEIDKFVSAVMENNKTKKIHGLLERFRVMVRTFPEIKSHLDISAGEDYPQGATFKGLLDISEGSCLVTGSLTGLSEFTFDQVSEAHALLNRNIKQYTSHRSVSFFNVLSRSGLLPKMTGEQKEQVLNWVRKWGKQAEEFETGMYPEERDRIVSDYLTQHFRLEDETDIEIVSSVLRNKAVALAEAMEITDDPTMIEELGQFVEASNPNELYITSSKKIAEGLKAYLKK